MVGWLVWVSWPFETVFQAILCRLLEKKRYDRDEQNVQIIPPAPTASTLL